MPDLQGIKKAKNKGKKRNPGPQDFKKQKVKVGRKVSFATQIQMIAVQGMLEVDDSAALACIAP